nr:hypothetical protein [Tanacetum cinerariifolium]
MPLHFHESCREDLRHIFQSCQLLQKTSFCTTKPIPDSVGAVADVKDGLHSFTPLRKTGNSFGAFESAVADVKDELHSFTPLGNTGNSFGAFERASRAANAAVTPWSIIAYNRALVIDVALIVSWSTVDLVVRLGAICF